MRPPRMDTAQLTLVRQPFDHPDFLFELKHDAFRALAGSKLLARVLVPLLNIPETPIEEIENLLKKLQRMRPSVQ
jgi:hypothetical protein